MRKIRLNPAALSTVLSFAAVLVLNFGAGQAAGNGVISGTVKGESGKPLDGILVRLINA